MPNTFYPTVAVKRLSDVPMPAYAKPGDAGLDLVSTENVTLEPGEWRMVGSGISVAIPRGFVGLVMPRSGMGCKGLVLKNTVGVIDSGYRGEIGLALFNNNKPAFSWYEADDDGHATYHMVNGKEIHVHKGDRVAQLLIIPVSEATLVEVDKLPDSERGDGGFGSTGTRPEGTRL